MGGTPRGGSSEVQASCDLCQDLARGHPQTPGGPAHSERARRFLQSCWGHSPLLWFRLRAPPTAFRVHEATAPSILATLPTGTQVPIQVLTFQLHVAEPPPARACLISLRVTPSPISKVRAGAQARAQQHTTISWAQGWLPSGPGGTRKSIPGTPGKEDPCSQERTGGLSLHTAVYENEARRPQPACCPSEDPAAHRGGSE